MKKSSPWLLVVLGLLALAVGLPLVTCGTCATYTIVGTRTNSHPTLRRGDVCENTSQCEGSLVCHDNVCK